MNNLQITRKWAIDTLRAYGLLSSPKIPTLPPEILHIIISYAIGPIIEPYRFLDSSNFPLFIARQRLSSRDLLGDGEYFNLLMTYHNIRLASHTFHSFAGLLPAIISRSQEPNPQGVQFLEAKYLSINLPIDASSSQITTLILRTSSQVKHFFSCSYEFPKLCSLSLNHVIDIPNLWKRLSTFSQLISLSIQGRIEHQGALVLPSLITFHLNWPYEYVEFKLPSLKHFSCLYVPNHAFLLENFRQFLDIHIRRLQSFIIPKPFHKYAWYSPPFTNREVEFWDQCPNLVTIGIHAKLLRSKDLHKCLQSPPTHHPLRHLYINLDETNKEEVRDPIHSLDLITKLLDRIPQIKYISVDGIAWYTGSAKFLREICSRRGIEATILPSPTDTIRGYEIVPRKWYEFGSAKLVIRPLDSFSG